MFTSPDCFNVVSRTLNLRQKGMVAERRVECKPILDRFWNTDYRCRKQSHSDITMGNNYLFIIHNCPVPKQKSGNNLISSRH